MKAETKEKKVNLLNMPRKEIEERIKKKARSSRGVMILPRIDIKIISEICDQEEYKKKLNQIHNHYEKELSKKVLELSDIAAKEAELFKNEAIKANNHIKGKNEEIKAYKMLLDQKGMKTNSKFFKNHIKRLIKDIRKRNKNESQEALQ